MAARLKLQDIDIEAANDRLKPQLDLVASYTARGLSGSKHDTTVPFAGFPIVFDEDFDGGPFTSLHNLARMRFPDASVGVQVSIPLGNRAAKADVAVAQSARRQTLTLRDQRGAAHRGGSAQRRHRAADRVAAIGSRARQPRSGGSAAAGGTGSLPGRPDHHVPGADASERSRGRARRGNDGADGVSPRPRGTRPRARHAAARSQHHGRGKQVSTTSSETRTSYDDETSRKPLRECE